MWEGGVGEGDKLSDRGAEDDQVGMADGGGEVGGDVVGDVAFLAEGDGFGAADVAGDVYGRATFPEGEAQRAAEKAYAHQGNVREMHGS